jgi:hypothetical protein
MKKPISEGTHDVSISPKQPKDGSPLIFPSCYTVKAPEIGSISQSSASVGDLITIKGRLFGTKKGKVFLVDGSGNQIKCKVISWTMAPETNDSEIVFTISKKAGAENYNLVVTNQIGSHSLESALRVE